MVREPATDGLLQGRGACRGLYGRAELLEMSVEGGCYELEVDRIG